jgi:spermidine synthase
MAGVAVVQATSPYYARRAFWSIAATMEKVGLSVLPMHVYVPSFGEWGFVIAATHPIEPPTALRIDARALVYLEDELLPPLFRFPRDMDRVDVPVNRLNDQKLVSIYTSEWEEWAR